ncbi:MAG: GHKL domain-containing protein, partial [Burkholderiales bacterium]
VTWEIAPQMRARADPTLLRNVLANLLGNAWKYTARSTAAQIRFTARSEGRETIYCIEDNGAGFDPVYRDQLFVPFQRLHDDCDFPGTGLGLASAKRIIERHGGRIWAESEVGKGARFHFALGSAVEASVA